MGLLMGNRGQVLVLLIVLGVLFSAVHFFVIPVKASPLTTVTLTLQEDPPTVDVSPGSSGIVEMHGTITCIKYGPDDVKVFLSGSSDFGPAPAEPSNFVFSGITGSEETQPFIVSTRVPMGTSSSLTPSLMVQGYFDQGGLRNTIPQVSQIIIIMQYYKIEYFIEDREVSVKSGENIKIEFVMVNAGNGEDIFEIDFKNRETLQNKGFKLPAPLEVQMAEDTNKSISLEIGAPDGNKGNYIAEVSILSKGSLGSDFPEEAIMSIRVEVTSSLGGQIVSLFISPITLLIAVIVVVIVIILRMKRKKEIPSNENL